MDVAITTGKDGVLTVHRATCGKLGDRETATVDDYLGSDPAKLTVAKKASCCKPGDAVLEEIEQEAWAALEAAAEATEEAGEDEDLIGDVQQNDDGITAEDEDLIGELADEDIAPSSQDSPKAKAAISAATKREAKRELNGLEALQKVAAHLDINVGKKPVFPGFGKAFKTADKQSVYINSKGNSDVRAKDAAQADEWAALDHVERRAGNYVRVNLAAL